MNHPSQAAVRAGCQCTDCHPSEAAYVAGCKCDPCMRRRMRVRKLHHIRSAQGPVMVQTDMTEIRSLIGEGFGVDLIAVVLGVSDNTITGLLNGGRTDRIRAAAIRCLTRDEILERAPDNAHVPTIGARRRIHALMRIGWPHLAIADGNRSTMRLVQAVSAGGGSYMLAATHRLIASRFDALGMTIGPSSIVRKLAEKRGYPPPLAWDDIDDPAARPQTGEPEPAAKPDHSERQAMYDQGMSDRAIARHEHVSADTIRYWRMANKLPPHSGGKTLAPLGTEGDNRYALWQQGMGDKDIAAAVGRHPDVIRRWRGKHGLELGRRAG